MNKYFACGALCLLLLLLPGILPLRAETPLVDGAMDYGFKTYFRYHPPKDKTPSRNLYPFPGPVIHAGEDIPVCAAARAEAAYLAPATRGMKYIVHGRDGWLFRTADFRTDFTASGETMSYFDRLNRLLAAKGQALVVVFQPPRAMLESRHLDPGAMPKGYSAEKARQGYREFIKRLGEVGIQAVDLSEPPADKDYFSKADSHWSPDGAIWSAQAVAKAVKALPAYDALPRQKFETRLAGVAAPGRGAFEEFIQKTCRVNIEVTARPEWTTAAIPAGSSAPSRNAAVPAVTLLGTSNSAEDGKFDFSGALKQALSTDVNNAAMTAGGFGLSPYSYFASSTYHEHPPKIVIWEFPSQYNFNNPAASASFRQMLPAIDGGCSDRAALAKWSGALADNETDIFGGAAKLPLKDAYLYLEASGAAGSSLRAEILYKNGEADEIDMTPSADASGAGRYYLELGDMTLAPPLFFHVISAKPGGSLTARLCRASSSIAGK